MSRREASALRQLKNHLTFICTAITGAVLFGMALVALSVSEVQFRRASLATFQSNINSIVHKLQYDQSISNSYLAKAESSEHLIIHIEDNRIPLFFHGSWSPRTDRDTLIAEAQRIAQEDYQFDLSYPPLSMLEPSSVTFDLRGEKGERYLAAAVLIPSQHSYQSLTLLREMRSEDQQMVWIRIILLGVSLLAIMVLFFFSRWFSTRAIRPVEEGQQKQIEFVAASSHELRSPLAVIQASTAAIRANPEQGEHFLDISRECSRMARLVDDLLILAGSDAKTWSIHPGKVDVESLLIQTLEPLLPIAQKKQQHLSLELPDETLPHMEGDLQRLQQGLTVLIDNALCYTPPESRIILRASETSQGIRIEVEDNGPGIPAEKREHIFERFYRADRSRNDKSHFGLGLNIALELIRLHGGTLTLRESDPHGCTFVIDLPRTLKK